MQFKTDGEKHLRLAYIDVEHVKTDPINFSMRTFNRTTFVDSFRMFDSINKFINSLSYEDQNKLHAIYVDVKDSLEQIKDPNQLHAHLVKCITNLYNLITFEGLKAWFVKHGSINIPPDLKETFNPEDNELTRQLTYLRKDYYDLVILSTLLKLAAPIFGVYLEIVDKDIGSKFKEHRVFSLLARSSVIELESFKRLQIYIDASIEKEKRKNQSNLRTSSSIFAGLGSEELPNWLLSKTVIRKLMLHEEFSTNSAIAGVYHAIEQHIASLDKNFGGQVREKKEPFKENDGDRTSLAENYKVKQSISDGDLTILSIYTDELLGMVRKIEPNIDPALLELCDDNLAKNNYMDITGHQLGLAQWALHKAISPRGIPALKKTSILKALAGTQAILWQWGFKELALLITVSPYSGDEMMSGGSTRIDNKRVQLMNELYPHHQIKTKNTNSRNTNPALKAVNKMSTMINANDWLSFSPVELDSEMGINPKNRVLYPSPDINTQLVDLIVKLNEK